MINKKQFLQILGKYNAGNATVEEAALLNAYYNLFESEPEIADLMPPSEILALKNSIGAGVFDKIGKLENNALPKTTLFRWWMAAAAVILILLSFSLYFLQNTKTNRPSATFVLDVKPGGNKAVLTLADGSKVILDDSKRGLLANQGNATISRSAEGQITYDASSASDMSDELVYNTLETPSGGKFQVVLPDGSHVWLNAESSIRYPAMFSETERKVEIKGEAYFEIAKDKRKPFRVVANQQLTEVLGTHFNINSYSDERLIKTTLFEGSIKVSTAKGDKVAFLKPGQQSQLMNNNDLNIVANSDLDEAIGWRNDLFQFNGTELSTIMRQLSRWYDVDVDFSRLPRREFVGVIPRNVPLSQVLRMLELTSNLKFKIVQANEKGGRRTIMLK